MNLDKRIQYVIYLDATYIIVFLISLLPLIPEIEIFQRSLIIFLFASCIYFVVRISQAVCGLDFFSYSQWLYYTSRIVFTVVFFLLHFMLMHTSLLISGNLMISQKLIDTKYFPTEHVTFYIYDDDKFNFKTAISVRQSILPIHHKILSEELLSPEHVSITCSDGDFIITDGDYTYYYPCKYHRHNDYTDKKH